MKINHDEKSSVTFGNGYLKTCEAIVKISNIDRVETIKYKKRNEVVAWKGHPDILGNVNGLTPVTLGSFSGRDRDIKSAEQMSYIFHAINFTKTNDFEKEQ